MFLKFSNILALLGREGVNTRHIASEVCTRWATSIRADVWLIVTTAKLIAAALAWVFHRVTQLFRLWNIRLGEVFLLCTLENDHIRILLRVLPSLGTSVQPCDVSAALGLFRCLKQLNRCGLFWFCREIIDSLRGCCNGFSGRDNATFAAGALARHPQKLLNLTVIDFNESGHVSVSSSLFASRWNSIRQLDLAHVNFSISEDVHWHQSLFDLDKLAIRGLGASWVNLFLAAF